MEILLPNLQSWFEQKREYFAVFTQHDSRVEGWFKGELLLFLKQQEGVNYQCEIHAPHSKKRVDFQIIFENQVHWVELKALTIGQAKGQRDLAFYFRDNDKGLIKDFRKLDRLVNLPHKWVLAFVYPTPAIQKWQNQIKNLPADLHHWQSVTAPQQSSHFFISLWKG